MRFLSSGKEQKTKPKEKVKTKPEKFSLPKCSVQAGIKISSVHKRLASEKRENPVKKVVLASRSETSGKEATCESSTPSWASDHNYNAVKPEKPEKPTALSPTLLSKCTYHPKAGFPGLSHHLGGCLGLSMTRVLGALVLMVARSSLPARNRYQDASGPQVFLPSLWSVSGCFPKSCVGLMLEAISLFQF